MDILETQGMNLNTNSIYETEAQSNQWNGLEVSQKQTDPKTQKAFEQSISIEKDGTLTTQALFADQVGVVMGGSGSVEKDKDSTTVKGKGTISDKSKDGNIKWGVSGEGQVSVDNEGNVEKSGKIEASVEGEF